MLHGTYQADCAPYDGSAFRITLPTGPARQIELRANAPLAAMAGTWTHTSGNVRPGTATILTCRTRPELVCDYPVSGTFTVSGKPGGPISRTFTATFPYTPRQTRHFTARPVRGGGTMLCG